MSMTHVEQRAVNSPADYDAVAELYDRAFHDIRVRRDEWRWLNNRLNALRDPAHPPRVLDIGCGNGSLLVALAPMIHSGVGVDISARTLDLARRNAQRFPQLTFQTLSDSRLPFPDGSFDLAISFLSFRYLDWDASLREIKRVLTTNGRLLIVDMASQRVRPRDIPLLLRSTLRHLVRPFRDRSFHRHVTQLTTHPDWLRMLQRNPIRSEQHYRECFARWFPSRSIDVLNTTLSKRVIAFDSGPFPRR